MSSIILYYTLGGATRAEARRLATESGAQLCEVREQKKRGLFSAFFPGCPHAMQRRASKLQPLGIDLNAYDNIVIGCPIWANFPAPAFNAIAAQLPAGKQISLFFCSGGGDSSKSAEGTKGMIAARGCTLVSYRDVKTEARPSAEK
ncbi:MAG: hypothetical protein ABT01_07000 [Clostridium sp. SCN 57-10]|nr:MAG: hypothetical protein ABT01_07000 [Clostridium sp. SCN 57-10]